jgi:hypothetical protein
MSKLGPADYQWDAKAEVMRPLKRHLILLQETCVDGAVYKLEPSRRSQRSHNHQFREIDIAWHNLPEKLHERFPSSEHLRKWALCEGGYCNVDQHVEPTRERAERLVRMILRLEQFAQTAIVPLDENHPDGTCSVITKLAWSQSKAAMGGTMFQESKDACLDSIAGLLETTPDALKQAAREAA